MKDRPELNLPQRPAPKASSGAVGGMILALVLVVIVLQTLSLLIRREAPPASNTPGGNFLTAEDHKALAIRLEDKNLLGAAAEAWEGYLREADLSEPEAAKVLLQIGKLKQESGDYQGAIHDYYLAEGLLHDQDEELTRTIALRVRECFRKLGQYDELSREMAERAAGPGGDTSLAGQQVVAAIGDEKITVAEFDRMVRAQIELAVKSQLSLSPEEADAFRQRAHDRLADPQAKARQLRELVIARVLAKEARAQGVGDSPEFRERMIALSDSMLASTLMFNEVSKRATVTPRDVERFFDANKDRYAEPATTTIARILCDTEEQAQEVIARAQEGEPFEDLAKELSTDEATRDSGGVMPQPVREDGDAVPGVGRDAELHGQIWASSPGTVLERPYAAGDAWAVVKIVDHAERVEKSLDEVREQAEYDTRLARQQEVTQQYIDELFKRDKVTLYPEAFSFQPKTEKDKPE